MIEKLSFPAEGQYSQRMRYRVSFLTIRWFRRIVEKHHHYIYTALFQVRMLGSKGFTDLLTVYCKRETIHLPVDVLKYAR